MRETCWPQGRVSSLTKRIAGVASITAATSSGESPAPMGAGASSFHLIDHPVALMLASASVGVPFATWLMKGYFDSIPRELERPRWSTAARRSRRSGG
jgi:ABC-type glycerol-3-phosphate transport system permease component